MYRSTPHSARSIDCLSALRQHITCVRLRRLSQPPPRTLLSMPAVIFEVTTIHDTSHSLSPVCRYFICALYLLTSTFLRNIHGSQRHRPKSLPARVTRRSGAYPLSITGKIHICLPPCVNRNLWALRAREHRQDVEDMEYEAAATEE